MSTLVEHDQRIAGALEHTLGGLKDFQRATVERVVALFDDPRHSQRVLVADEVGLGKTIVAKGIIASLLKGWKKPRPMRVTYICSNLALAAENRKKLAVFETKEAQALFVKEPSFGRLAELAIPAGVQEGAQQVLEVCSLTPATSFSLTRGIGNRQERLIILAAVLRHPDLTQCEAGLKDLFREPVRDARSWDKDLQKFLSQSMHSLIVGDFHAELQRTVDESKLGSRNWIEAIRKIAAYGIDWDDAFEKNFLRKLRQVFVKCCAANLEADLFILDEFQRFKDLIDDRENSEQALIARQVFSKPLQGKVLLLSATPFKAMTTLSEDEQDEAHLTGLRQVLKFLNIVPLDTYEPARQALQHELYRLRHSHVRIEDLSAQARERVESVLRPLIARTERVQIAADVDDVLESTVLDCGQGLRRQDIEAYVELDGLGQQLKSDPRYRLDGQLIEFFKSAAWPLAFSSGYQLQDVLKRRYMQDEGLQRYLRRNKSLWLPRELVDTYELRVAEHAPNPNVRAIARHLLGDGKQAGPEMLLWVPPSLPHYPLRGPFATHEGFSKTLIFSAWAMVPRMLSGLLSYESERRLLGKRYADARYFPAKRRGKAHGDPATSNEHVRLIRLDAGELANWILLYPSRTLAGLALRCSGRTLEQLIASRTKHFETLLEPLRRGRSGTRNRQHWYLLAPLLLDQRNDPDCVAQWFERQRRAHPSGLTIRLEEIEQKLMASDHGLGEMPADLATFLAWLSLGSPAVCAYRALKALPSGDSQATAALQQDATSIAMAFISLFNSMSGVGVMRRFAKQNKIPISWKSVVKYCAQGGLQAVLEEYLYMMSPREDAAEAVATICDVLRTSPSTVKVWDIRARNEHSTNLRCHYAVPFGTQKMSDESGQERVVSIRESFNSPFRPFVLTSTSIGQEGLDFHWYCSEIVHWNLPDNPIDLEQREGRINRFQSLVVRRRIVERFVPELMERASWDTLFKRAEKVAKQTDLIPFWHFPKGRAQIRRLVPLLPYSRERHRYRMMLKILSLYRLAFGQPGQHELLEYLRGLDLSAEEISDLKRRLMVNLAPINYFPCSVNERYAPPPDAAVDGCSSAMQS